MRCQYASVHVLGSHDSPIVPVMLYNPTKIAGFSRMCLERGIAVVVVGFPATPLLLSRVRFCLSAGHTTEELEKVMDEIEDVCRMCMVTYQNAPFEAFFSKVGNMYLDAIDTVRSITTGAKSKRE